MRSNAAKRDTVITPFPHEFKSTKSAFADLAVAFSDKLTSFQVVSDGCQFRIGISRMCSRQMTIFGIDDLAPFLTPSVGARMKFLAQ